MELSKRFKHPNFEREIHLQSLDCEVTEGRKIQAHEVKINSQDRSDERWLTSIAAVGFTRTFVEIPIKHSSGSSHCSGSRLMLRSLGK